MRMPSKDSNNRNSANYPNISRIVILTNIQTGYYMLVSFRTGGAAGLIPVQRLELVGLTMLTDSMQISKTHKKLEGNCTWASGRAEDRTSITPMLGMEPVRVQSSNCPSGDVSAYDHIAIS
jgi:hypothetical protein